MPDLPINQVIVGDCREVMRDFPENSIDFCMFSPPYYGLRDYGEEAESVWGGDEGCNHEWGGSIEVSMSGGEQKDEENYGKGRKFENSSSVCSKCGAWRGQFGLEPDYRMYVQHLVEIGRGIKRILKPSGSWYLNLGDTYYSGKGQSAYAWSTRHAEERIENNETLQKEHHQTAGMGETRPQDRPQGNIKQKCKMLMPYRVALALIDDGWICRNDLIWLKPNPMPSSVKDRLNTTTEKIFHFVKKKKYYYDLDAIRERYKETSKDRYNYDFNPDLDSQKVTKSPAVGAGNIKQNKNGKNPGDVIEQTTQPFPEAHFAVYPPDLCEKPIKSSCPPKVCAECGEPYERIVERELVDTEGWGPARKDRHNGVSNPDSTIREGKGRMGRSKVKHKGWKKTCDCSTDETKSGIVLDPMCGAGSTLLMAEKLGRKYIGIEINPEYAKMAKRRVKKSLNGKVPKKREVKEDIPELEAFVDG